MNHQRSSLDLKKAKLLRRARRRFPGRRRVATESQPLVSRADTSCHGRSGRKNVSLESTSQKPTAVTATNSVSTEQPDFVFESQPAKSDAAVPCADQVSATKRQRFGMRALGPDFAQIRNPTQCVGQCERTCPAVTALQSSTEPVMPSVPEVHGSKGQPQGPQPVKRTSA